MLEEGHDRLPKVYDSTAALPASFMVSAGELRFAGIEEDDDSGLKFRVRI